MRSLAFVLSACLGLGCGPPSRAVENSLSKTQAIEVAPLSSALPQHAAPEVLLSVMSLNDLHGRIGALPAFAGYVEALQNERGSRGGVLLVDAGDLFQGTLASNQTEGACVVRAYNALGFAAAAIGNHEFDYGPEKTASVADGALPQGALRQRLSEANFPFLAANLLDTATGKLPAWNNLRASARIDVAGVRIGVIGVLTHDAPSIILRDSFAGLDVTALAPAVEREARKLRAEGVDAVLVLAHAGAECQRFDDPRDLSSCNPREAEAFELARALPPGLVDALVSGHTHAGVAHTVNGVAIVQAYSRGKAFSRIDLRFSGAPRRLVEVRLFAPEPLCPESAELAACSTHAYAGRPVRASQAIESLVSPELDIARQARARVVGLELSDDLKAERDRESPLGNLFVDAMLAHVPGAQIAISNSGSLRATLPRGPLSYGALYETMPFDNRLVKLRVTGAELRRVLEAHLGQDARGIVAISGFRVLASCRNGTLRVALTDARGRGLRDAEELTLVTSDYLATGGDRLLTSIEGISSRVEPVGEQLLRDAVALEFAKLRHVDAHSLRWYDAKRPRLVLPTARPVTCDP